MSRWYKLLFGILTAIALTATIGTIENVQPVPMPLHNAGKHAGFAAPQPHREEAVRKWLGSSLRIRNGGVSGSGTICYYDASTNTAYMISCAHLYNGGEKTVTVEAFYKNNEKLSTPQRYTAEVLAVGPNTYGEDISFLKFTPDWKPETYFPIAPIDYLMHRERAYISCGCDGAGEVAAYFVKISGKDGPFIETHENSPRPGRSGGGLMSEEGFFVGICVRTSNVDGSGTGYFVPVEAIHKFAQSKNLQFLLGLSRPNDILRQMPIIDRNLPQGDYPRDYIPLP